MFPQINKSVGNSSKTLVANARLSSSSPNGSGMVHRSIALLQCNGNGLPPELLGIICHFLNLKSIMAFTSACKYLYERRYPRNLNAFPPGFLPSQVWKFPPSRPYLAYRLESNGMIGIPKLKLSEGISFLVNSSRYNNSGSAWMTFFAQELSIVKNICNQVTNLCLNDASLMPLSTLNYFSAVEILKLEAGSLTAFPNDLIWPPSLKTLTLSSNDVQAYPSTLETLTQLEMLELYMRLAVFPDDVFWPPALKVLTLLSGIQTCPPKLLKNLSQLETLHLYVDNLTAFPNEVIWPPALKTLTLRATKLQTCPPKLESLSLLETLTLEVNDLTAFPNEVVWPPALKTLTLRATKLQTFPPKLESLSQLETLTLDCGPLPVFPDDIIWPSALKTLTVKTDFLERSSPLAALWQLETLTLNLKQLKVFSGDIIWPPALKTLTIQMAKLKTYPPKLLEALTQLETLTLAIGNLTDFPDDIIWPPALKTLIINSQSQKIPSTLLKTRAPIETLTLELDRLNAFPVDFIWPSTLKTLTVKAGCLWEWPPALNTLTQLETLVLDVLDRNDLPIDVIWPPALKTLKLIAPKLPRLAALTHLETLELRVNILSWPYKFVWPGALKTLTLSLRSIEEVSEGTLRNLTQLTTLNIFSRYGESFPVDFIWPPALKMLTFDHHSYTNPFAQSIKSKPGIGGKARYRHIQDPSSSDADSSSNTQRPVGSRNSRMGSQGNKGNISKASGNRKDNGRANKEDSFRGKAKK